MTLLADIDPYRSLFVILDLLLNQFSAARLVINANRTFRRIHTPSDEEIKSLWRLRMTLTRAIDFR
jgi:hypothetical protein